MTLQFEELVEVSKVFSQKRVQQRFGEQTTEPPATSFVEKIVEMLVTQTREQTQQVANTHVQHVVNTVKVEKPKIIKQRMQKPVIQEKINQATKRIEVPQFLNEVVDMLDAVQRQVSMVQKIQKITKNPRLQIVEQIVEVPEIQMFDDTQTSESLGIAPVRQVAQVENVEVIEIGAPPMSVTAPVLEVPPVVVEYTQPVSVAEYVEPAPAHAVTFAHAAPPPAVTCAAPASARVQPRTVQQTVDFQQVKYIDKVTEVPRHGTVTGPVGSESSEDSGGTTDPGSDRRGGQGDSAGTDKTCRSKRFSA